MYKVDRCVPILNSKSNFGLVIIHTYIDSHDFHARPTRQLKETNEILLHNTRYVQVFIYCVVRILTSCIVFLRELSLASLTKNNFCPSTLFLDCATL